MASHIFLVRGLAREQRHWGEFRELLKTKYSSVFCLELPGVGIKYKKCSPWSIKGYVRDLRKDFLEVKSKLDKDDQLTVLGVSLGGMIVMEWLNLHPEDFDNAVVINSSAKNLCKTIERLRPSAFSSLVRIGTKTEHIESEREVLKLVANTDMTEEKILEWATYAEEFPLKKSTFIRQVFAAMRFNAPIKIQTPILFLASKADKMVSVNCSEKLASYYNANLSLHTFGGHDLALDDGEWILQEIQNLFHNS